MKFWILYEGAQYELDLDLILSVSLVKNTLFNTLQIPPVKQILKDPETGLILEDCKKLDHYYGFGRIFKLPMNVRIGPPYSIEVKLKSEAIEENLFASNLASTSNNNHPVKTNPMKSQPDGKFDLLSASTNELRQVLFINNQNDSSINLLQQRIVQLEDLLEQKTKENKMLMKEENDIGRKFEFTEVSNSPQSDEMKLKNRQIELLAKENFELLKEIEILNETMAALPTRLEADIGIEDSRIKELENEIQVLNDQFSQQEAKFHEEIKSLSSKLEDKNIELSETSLKLLEERANVLSLVNAVRKQEDENDTMKRAYEEKLKESEYNLKKLQENHANLNIQMNTLKTKWRGEARRIFHESMAYVQKNYKQMLAVEELGFLKSSEDFTPLKVSMNPSESVISITTSSSSYEQINDDLSESQMHVLENVEENDGTNK